MINFYEKQEVLALSKYFQIKKPQYVFLKLKPHTGIRNYDTASIIRAIHAMYKSVLRRIHLVEKKWVKDPPVKCSYMIDIYKDKVDFYFMVAQAHLDVAMKNIREVWPQIEIEELTEIPAFSQDALKYELKYKKEDGLSLQVDRKNNEPLNQILSVINVMEEEDRVTLFYNFIPCKKGAFAARYDKTVANLKAGIPADKNKFTFEFIRKFAFSLVVQILDAAVEVVQDVLGSEKPKKLEEISILNLALRTVQVDKDLKEATKQKRNAQIIKTQLVVLSESKDSGRKHSNAISACQSFGSIAGDNELIYKKLKKGVNVLPNKLKIQGVEVNDFSVEECQNLVQLPGKTLLTEFRNIDKIDTVQAPIVEELEKGVFRAGMNSYRGEDGYIHHTDHTELRHTAVCITGPNRSGKTTYLANMIWDAIRKGRTVILPDFCGKCKLSDELSEVIPKEKITNVDCRDWDKLQGFGWNEVKPRSNDIMELYDCAKIKAARLKELINLVNDDSNDLEGRMERYLEFAALVVFVSNGPVNDVFKILKSHTLRHEYINKIPVDLSELMEEHIIELKEIDELQSKGENIGEVIGTKQSHVSAILSRVHRLKSNTRIEKMLKLDTDNNIDLLEEIQQGKLILIRMYDDMFATQAQKDIYTCYWVTKIWGALQKRYCDTPNEDELVQTILMIDELYQTKNCEKYLTKMLSQMPKYKGKLILSCHHLAQIPYIQEELKSASCSYMFIRGSNKRNFNAMKEEFEDKGFSLEDLLHLKEFQALCLLTYEDGYWAGIVQLPPPLGQEE